MTSLEGVALERAQAGDGFYGFTEVRFHRHLGMAFSRAEPTATCDVTLPAAPDQSVSPAAAFVVAEVAGAMAVGEGLLPHAADIMAGAENSLLSGRAMLLTTRVHFRALADGRGTVRADARLTGDPEALVAKLRRVKKVKVEIEVDLFDGEETKVATATVYCYVRIMSQELLDEWGER